MKGDASIYLSAVDVTLGPAPSEELMALVPTRNYRVVFWEQQLPPEGSAIAPEGPTAARQPDAHHDVAVEQDKHQMVLAKALGRLHQAASVRASRPDQESREMPPPRIELGHAV
jgi:hypothetical protein